MIMMMVLRMTVMMWMAMVMVRCPNETKKAPAATNQIKKTPAATNQIKKTPAATKQIVKAPAATKKRKHQQKQTK